MTQARTRPTAVEALRLLGIARRAGAVVWGTDAARRAIRSGEARLVLMAGDASQVQLEKVRSALEHRPIPRGTLGDRATLGAAVGRAPVSVVAVTADSFAGPVSEMLGLVERSDGNGAED